MTSGGVLGMSNASQSEGHVLHHNAQQTRLNNNQNIQQSNTVGTGESRVGTGGVQCRIETGKGCFNV